MVVPAASTLIKPAKRDGMLRLVSRIGSNDLELLDDEKRKKIMTLKKAARRLDRGEFSSTVVKI